MPTVLAHPFPTLTDEQAARVLATCESNPAWPDVCATSPNWAAAVRALPDTGPIDLCADFWREMVRDMAQAAAAPPGGVRAPA